MKVAALGIRSALSENPIYRPFLFEGDWSLDEKNVIEASIDTHVPHGLVDSLYNTWTFIKVATPYFMATRFTWEWPMTALSVDELAEQLTAYYKEYGKGI